MRTDAQQVSPTLTITLIGFFRNVIGTRFDDYIAGDKVNNVLIGGEGNDTLVGREGADLLVGDTRDDKAVADSKDTLLDIETVKMVKESSNSVPAVSSLPGGPRPAPAGEALALNCGENSFRLADGTLVYFYGFCGKYEVVFTPLNAASLPGSLTGGALALGLKVSLLENGQVVDKLPAGSQIWLVMNGAVSGLQLHCWDAQADSGKGGWVELLAGQGVLEVGSLAGRSKLVLAGGAQGDFAGLPGDLTLAVSGK